MDKRLAYALPSLAILSAGCGNGQVSLENRIMCAKDAASAIMGVKPQGNPWPETSQSGRAVILSKAVSNYGQYAMAIAFNTQMGALESYRATACNPENTNAQGCAEVEYYSAKVVEGGQIDPVQLQQTKDIVQRESNGYYVQNTSGTPNRVAVERGQAMQAIAYGIVAPCFGG